MRFSPISRRLRAMTSPLMLVMAIVGAVLVSGLPEAAKPVHGEGVTMLRDLVYYEGPGAQIARQSLDLYLPPGSDFPWVVYAHGGGWSEGDKAADAHIGTTLAELGIGAAMVNYRLSDGGQAAVMHPAHVEDLARAVSFARAQLAARGISPTNMYLMGHEAGAHLVALLATNSRFLAPYGLGSRDIRGVIALAGVYSIAPTGNTFAEVFGTEDTGRRDASPLHNVTSAAPSFLLLYGSGDTASVSSAARNFADKLTSVGLTPVVKSMAERNVASLASDIGLPEDPTTDEIVAFIQARRHITATPSPTMSPTPTMTPTPTPADVRPPIQPATGPGGQAAPHALVRVIQPDPGPRGQPDPATRFWLFEPDSPAPPDAPVLVFLGHDGAARPDAYRTWLNHTARTGVIVIYLTHAVSGTLPTNSPGSDGTGMAATQLANALAKLKTEDHVAPRLDELAYAGHGQGAAIAANLAAGWYDRHLPLPRALFLVSPRNAPKVLATDLSSVPRDSRILLVAAADDAGRDQATEVGFWSRLAAIPGAWRQALTLSTDRHGTPPLVADFETAMTDGPGAKQNALDWYGTWKWLDALLACTFRRVDCAYAFGNTPEVRGLGVWQDGRPVRLAEWFQMPVRGDAGKVGWFPWVGKRGQ